MLPKPRKSVKPGEFEMVDMLPILDTPQKPTPPTVMTTVIQRQNKGSSQIRETSKLLQPHHVSHLQLKDRFKGSGSGDGETPSIPDSVECEYVEAEDATLSPNFFKPISPSSPTNAERDTSLGYGASSDGTLTRKLSITVMRGETVYDSFISVPVDGDETKNNISDEPQTEGRQATLETIPEQDLYLDLDSSDGPDACDAAGVHLQAGNDETDVTSMGGRLSNGKFLGDNNKKDSTEPSVRLRNHTALVKLRKPRNTDGSRAQAAPRPVSMPFAAPPEPPAPKASQHVINKSGPRPLPDPPSETSNVDGESSSKEKTVASRQSSMPQEPPPLPPTAKKSSPLPVTSPGRPPVSPNSRPTSSEKTPPIPPNTAAKTFAGSDIFPPLPPVPLSRPPISTHADSPPPLRQSRPPLPAHPAPEGSQAPAIPCPNSSTLPPVPGDTSPVFSAPDKPPPLPPGKPPTAPPASSETPPPPLPKTKPSFAPRLPYRPPSPFLKSGPGFEDTPPDTPKKDQHTTTNAPTSQTFTLADVPTKPDRLVHPAAKLIQQMNGQPHLKHRSVNVAEETDKPLRPPKKMAPTPPRVLPKPDVGLTHKAPTTKPKVDSPKPPPAISTKPKHLNGTPNPPRPPKTATPPRPKPQSKVSTLPNRPMDPHPVNLSPTLTRQFQSTRQLPSPNVSLPTTDDNPICSDPDEDHDQVYTCIDESQVSVIAFPPPSPELPSAPPPLPPTASNSLDKSTAGPARTPDVTPTVSAASEVSASPLSTKKSPLKSPRLKRPSVPPPPRPQTAPPKQPQEVTKKPAPTRPPPPSKKNIQAAEQRKAASQVENEWTVVRTNLNSSPIKTPKRTIKNAPKVAEVTISSETVMDGDSETYSCIPDVSSESSFSAGSEDAQENTGKDSIRKKKRSLSVIPSPVTMINRLRNKTKSGYDASIVSKSMSTSNGNDFRGAAFNDSFEEEGIYAGIDENPGLFNNVNANNNLYMASHCSLSSHNGRESNCTYAQLDHAPSSGE
uniref:Titin-like n=1 Tax=Phallusia mammillata TaxID=59560 RepID=A0A6F9D8L9_9ASCI|nr:titin-like [Phallusia mammillata]